MPAGIPVILPLPMRAAAIACGAPFLTGGMPAAHTSPEA